MDLASYSNGAPSHVCSGCERSFAGPGPLNFHRRSCRATKRRLQGVLVKAKKLWEEKKQLKRHLLDEPQPEKAAGNITDPLIMAATPTASSSGSHAALRWMAEVGSPPIPTESESAPMDSAGVTDVVWGQCVTVVHQTDSSRLWPLCRWMPYLVAPKTFL